MVLHNNGEYLDDLPDKVNLIYGTKFFNTVDYTLKEVIKSKNIQIYIKLCIKIHVSLSFMHKGKRRDDFQVD